MLFQINECWLGMVAPIPEFVGLHHVRAVELGM